MNEDLKKWARPKGSGRIKELIDQILSRVPDRITLAKFLCEYEE